MAMTKAEKQRVENLERALRMARALYWPEYPMPSPMTREEIEKNKVPGGKKHGSSSPQMVAFGYAIGPARLYSQSKITRSCSDGINHGWNDTTSIQGMGHQFRTELEAWEAIRLEITETFAEELARVDAMITRCRESGS